MLSDKEMISLREDMIFLYGQIEAAGFVINQSTGVAELWESISDQYKSIIDKVVGVKHHDG